MVRAFILTLAFAAANVASASAQLYPGQYGGQYGGQGGRPMQAQGVVRSFSYYDLYINGRNGRDQYVHLHQGTVINPRGTTLQSGMPVRVVGYIDGGGTFQANEIDVSNNGNCGQNGGYGNGQYGTGYYNGGANGGACAHNGNRGRHRGHGRHDNDDRDGRDNNNQGYGNPYPYPTPPPRLP